MQKEIIIKQRVRSIVIFLIGPILLALLVRLCEWSIEGDYITTIVYSLLFVVVFFCISVALLPANFTCKVKVYTDYLYFESFNKGIYCPFKVEMISCSEFKKSDEYFKTYNPLKCVLTSNDEEYVKLSDNMGNSICLPETLGIFDLILEFAEEESD